MAIYDEDGGAYDHPLKRLWNGLADFASGWPASLLDLGIRLWMAEIFFNSGLNKIKDMASAEFLFAEIHPVPGLDPGVAAYSATAVELVAPVLLAVGLFTRAAAIPMLVMALVIQFVVGANDPTFQNVEHYYWMMLLGVIILKGPGRISLDHFLGLR